jgi:hypothetical protein
MSATLCRFARPFHDAELRALLAVAAELDRTFTLPGGDVHERDFWYAFLRMKHDTGLSNSQLLGLPWRCIDIDRESDRPFPAIRFECRLSKPTWFAIGRILSPERDQIFALPEDFKFADRLALIRQFARWESTSDADEKGGGL